MFIGHYGVAMGARRLASQTSLGALLIAAQFPDLLWPVLLLLGVEHVRIAPGNTVFTPLDFYDYPISHSLLAVAGWAVLVAVVYFLARRSRRSSIVMAAAVVSHWVLDALSHRPDMPLVPGIERYVGLGLWNSLTLTLAVESAIFALGVLVYAQTTQPRDRAGSIGLYAFVLLLVVIYTANAIGPPPPSTQALVWTGMAQWLLIGLGYWMDRHRVAVSAQGC